MGLGIELSSNTFEQAKGAGNALCSVRSPFHAVLCEVPMPTEIERKFLVTGTGWRHANRLHISQGYLNRDKDRTVRVRLDGERAFLAVKGLTRGASRAEFEYEIPVADAEQLLKLCDGPVIQKVRHAVVYKGLTWEVDEFRRENAGLVVAEVELQKEDQPFERPSWLGREVTEDPRYFNSNLAMNPYGAWPEVRSKKGGGWRP